MAIDSLNPPRTKEFFFEFWSDFSVCTSPGPLKMKSEIIFFFFQPEVHFLGADRFDRLVLTGVRVTNFFKNGNFDLIFFTQAQG